MTNDHAWAEGYKAYEAGQMPFHNPYLVTDDAHDDWTEGWHDAESDAAMFDPTLGYNEDKESDK